MKKKKKEWKKRVGMLLSLVLLLGVGMDTRAAQKRIEECLIYAAEQMSWDDKQVYVNGYVYNDSSEYDIYALNDVELVVYDSEGTFIFSVPLDDDEMEEIVLAPGEIIPFNVVVAGRLNAGSYELANGFYADISAAFTYAKCGGKNCTICGGTRQTMQQTEQTGNSGIGTGIWQDYSWLNDYTEYDFGSTPSYETKCVKCGGTGRVECTSCDGTGYQTRTKYGIDLGAGSSKYEVRVRCGCDNGSYSCYLCGGDGVY